MEKKISYLNRNFHDYHKSLLDFTKQYYPELENEFNDASIGAWLLDVVSNIGDNLSYHIDRVYQETNIDSAQEKSSIYALARNNGFKIPGPKASLAEVKFSCELPINGNNGASGMNAPDWSYAPCIKRGTKVSAGNQVFELLHDVDFNEQFNENGISNRTFIPKRNGSGNIVKYVVSKTGIVASGETKIFTKVIESSDIKPFMNIVIPDTNIINIESIIVKDGTKHFSTPTLSEFYYDSESNDGKNDCGSEVPLWRFFEVDYLAQQYRWGDYFNDGITQGYIGESADGTGSKEHYIKKGAWIPLRQKFITEFTDSGYMRVIFGAGNAYNESNSSSTAPNTYEHLISHMVNNDGLGVLPKAGTTMYIMYRKGGGAASNVAQGAINNITYLKGNIRGLDDMKSNDVKRSLKVTNTTPSVSGKDMPTVEEIKYLIKYNNGAQERCVTIKDYHDRLSKMPPRYGCPFRYGVIEENNKIMIYTLGLNSNGSLTDVLPSVLQENIQNYLSEYRMINDYIEIKSGRIINLQFEIDMYVDKNYNTSDVVTNVIETVKKYMDIHKLQMGDDIFVGDIEKEISKIDGVLNLIELRVYNIFDKGYSKTKTMQQIMTPEECYDNYEGASIMNEEGRNRINLKQSDKMLYTENDTMFEIKYPEKDIICQVKTR